MSFSAAVLGATGNVGGRIVELLIANPSCTRVVVVARRKTGFTHAKVNEVIVEMDSLEAQLTPHLQGIDVALAAFGVGSGSAKMSEDEVRKIEVTYPLAFARAAKAGGARVCALMTGMSADPHSRIRTLRIAGEKEQSVAALGFDFLGIYRPGVILGNSNTPSALNVVMPLMHWAMPARFHSVHKNDLARVMVAQSEQALGQRGPPVVKVLSYPEMKPFFVEGDRRSG